MLKELQGNVTNEVFGGDPDTSGYLIPQVKAGGIVISPGVKIAQPSISPANPNNKPVVKPVAKECPDGSTNGLGFCWFG